MRLLDYRNTPPRWEDMAEMKFDRSPEMVKRILDLGYARPKRVLEIAPKPGMERRLLLAVIRLLDRDGTDALIVPRELNGPEWLDPEKELHPNGCPSLVSCVALFRELYPWYGTFNGAMGKCYIASRHFINFLVTRGVVSCGEAETETIYFGDPNDPEGCCAHTWVQIGRIAIDWTHRQFSDDKPFPYIYLNEKVPIKVMPLL